MEHIKEKLNLNIKFNKQDKKSIECSKSPAYCKENKCPELNYCENLDVYRYRSIKS